MLSEMLLVDENWQRHEYALTRGHTEYCVRARYLEQMYLGGGRQWSAEDLAILAEQKRAALEFNEIMPAVNAAVGYQIANRMDISFKPRGGMATQDTATVLSKVTMQIADNVDLHWKETDVFSDGLIQQRGFYDIRIGFDDNMRGEIRVDVLDPMDVEPDPDAKTYDPDGWNDVVVTRWPTLSEIEERYGIEARRKVESTLSGQQTIGEDDFGDSTDDGSPRSKFGSNGGMMTAGQWDASRTDKGQIRVRVVDRQRWEHKVVKVVVSPNTGDVRVVEGMEPELLERVLEEGGVLTVRRAKRVRWIVTTSDALLLDKYSPYPFFTIVPYFPYFRRGQTAGMVDNAVGPQEALNKAISQFIHVNNTAANSGWLVEEDSLTNMDTDDLEERGAKSGLVIEYRKGATQPVKIQPNQLPQGIDRIIDRCTATLKENTVPDAARGLEGQEKSGVAIQSRQFAAQQQLAIVLDNLGRTRNMLARRILWMIQNFYDDERIFRITKQNPTTGQQEDEELRVNVFDPKTGAFLNDLTIGEYDVVISETPMQVTFENGQFEQAMRMREGGVSIPDDVLIRNSNLAEKADLLQRMAQTPAQPDPLTEAEIALKHAQAKKTNVEAVTKSVESQFSAIQTAQTIAMTPATAPLADQLLKSAGFEDQDAAPIVPNAPEGIDALDMPENTNPLTPLNPENPAVGMNEGIETPRADS